MSANKYGRSIQCWPSGRMLEVIGDPPTEIRRHTGNGWGEWRPITPLEAWEVKVQETAQRLLAQEVYCCDSCLVSDMTKAAMEGELTGEIAREWDYDQVSNLRPDPSDWDLEQCREYLEEHGHGQPDPNPWEMDRAARLAFLEETAATFDAESTPELTDDELLAECVRVIDDGGCDGLDDWREAVRDNADSAEIYEWYRVSKWLAEKLEAIGECVLDNAYGEWWGRQGTGQGVIMDGTFQKIAELLHAGEKPKDETAG